ncbi:MAG TPA: NADH-quinone oxidoreductase subunit J [Chloroflexota bacterium]|nr:NADH-quinone oxidoreductase subunit J [Chloroflexota bacterium]
MELVTFLAVAALSVASALMMIVQRNAMYSALFLVLNFFCLAVFYVLLGAYFLAVVQVAVYAGAIMVLMLFVIMLLNVAQAEPTDRRLGLFRPFGVIAALILLGELVAVGARYGSAPSAPVAGEPVSLAFVTPTPLPTATAVTAGAATVGHTQEVAAVLFSRYLFPFEVTSILLLGAILGATILARKRPDTEDVAHVAIVQGERVK